MLKTFLLEGLNEAQCEAVQHGEGPAMVVAGPGSGKTLTIIRRLLYLIYEKHVPADKILVITYTKEAALSMQHKFYEQKNQLVFRQNDNQGYVSFGTFHSYFYQIIKNIKKYSEYQLINPQEKIKLANKILKEELEEISDFEIRSFLEQVSFYKNTGRLKSAENDIISKIQKYLKFLQEYKRMDFDDMLYLCREELKLNSNLLAKCKERYEYILIDEYQDINPIQYELIQMITGDKQNVFVVGDDDQAIYGFRGSDGKCFHKFLNDYKNPRIVQLNVNYRCTDSIVRLSQKLISKNKKRLEKKIISGVSEKISSDVHLIGSVNLQEMYNHLIGELIDRDKEDLCEEAVLFRTNASLQSFANVLASKQIPFVLREKIQSYYEHFIVCDILDFFNASLGCKDRSLYIRIFNKLRVPIGRTMLSEEQIDFAILKRNISDSIYDKTYIIEQIDKLERQLQWLTKLRPKLGITYILHAMGYEKYLIMKSGNHAIISDEWKEVLEWLQEEADGYIDFRSWKQHLECGQDTMGKHIKQMNKNTKGIHLMTMHAAKGLEFNKVYILNLNDGVIPKIKKGEMVTEELIEEERRLFYVAITRAKKQIELHYVKGTKENSRLSSRFLEEIGLIRDRY